MLSGNSSSRPRLGKVARSHILSRTLLRGTRAGGEHRVGPDVSLPVPVSCVTVSIKQAKATVQETRRAARRALGRFSRPPKVSAQRAKGPHAMRHGTGPCPPHTVSLSPSRVAMPLCRTVRTPCTRYILHIQRVIHRLVQRLSRQRRICTPPFTPHLQQTPWEHLRSHPDLFPDLFATRRRGGDTSSTPA